MACIKNTLWFKFGNSLYDCLRELTLVLVYSNWSVWNHSTDLRWKAIANGGVHGVGGPGWRHKAVCIAGKSMPRTGEAVGRAAIRVRRNGALVYSAWRKRLRSVNSTAGIRYSCNEEDYQPWSPLEANRESSVQKFTVTKSSVLVTPNIHFKLHFSTFR